MSQKERNEWIERAKERVLRNAKETDTYVRDIMDLYDETANQLENEINAMFQKYAQDNKLDNAEAEKLLSSEEYSRWRKSMVKAHIPEAGTTKCRRPSRGSTIGCTATLNMPGMCGCSNQYVFLSSITIHSLRL